MKYPVKTTLKCNDCGSFLFLVSKDTEKGTGKYSSVVTSQYECSNETCKKDFNRKMAQRIKHQEEQDAAREKRIENNKQRILKTAKK